MLEIFLIFVFTLFREFSLSNIFNKSIFYYFVQKYNSCKNAEEVITTKSLDLLPVIKKESRDVEEVAVSPERRKVQRPSAKTSENGNGATTSASSKAPPVIRDAPIQNRGRIISDSEDDEPIVRKRNLRKRRSGHGPAGAEVTSGFDRHRAVIDDSSEEENSDDGGKSPPVSHP